MQRHGRIETVTVSASRSHDGRWVIGLEGVTSMNDAEALRGCELRVSGDTLHELDAGRFYVHDLAGCTVQLTSGDVIGRVERVDFNAGIPLLVVAGETPETSGTAGDSRDPHADEILVPFTDAICRRIDVQARVIEIDPPEGLVELNRRKRK
jgi:16S rRNA processing protein RimM